MKKSWIAGLFSLIFPGLGHFYLEKFTKGLLLVGLQILFYIVSQKFELVAFALLLTWIYAIVDSIKDTKKYNESKKRLVGSEF
ncbi:MULTISPECIES: sugar ABC transporter permease [Lysinibacillus]|uniref:sugar ABC transporter permease n=1 Tax=Lysinibacillus TaxID=400634 RepID=UPI0030F73CF3